MRFIALSHRPFRLLVFTLLSMFTVKQALGQNSASGGAVQGVVKDSSGAVIPGATITLTDENGGIHKSETRGDGHYVVRGLPPATYGVKAEFSGLEQSPATLVTVSPNQIANANVSMRVAAQKEEVTVTGSNTNQISTEAANNAAALVLRQEDLDACPMIRTIWNRI